MAIEKRQGESIEQAYVRTRPEQFSNSSRTVSVRSGETVAQANARTSGQETVSSSNQQLQQASPAPKPKPAYATLPSGQTVPVSAGVAEKLRQGQADEQARQIMLSNNPSFSKTPLTEKQYAEKYPRQYEEERRGMAVSASDVALNENPDDAIAAQIRAKHDFAYPAPRERFDFVERSPTDLERNLLKNQANMNNIPKNPLTSNMTSDIITQDSFLSQNLKSLKNWSSRQSDKLGGFSEYARERSRETNVIGKVGWGLAGGAVAPIIQIPFFVVGNSEYIYPALKRTFTQPITTLKEMGGATVQDITSDPVYTISGYAGMAVAPKFIKASFGDRITGVFRASKVEVAYAADTGKAAKITPEPKIKLETQRGYEIKNLQTIKVAPGEPIIGKVSGVSKGKGWDAEVISRIKGGVPDKSIIGKKNPVFSYNPVQAGVPDIVKQAGNSKIKIDLPDGTKLKVGKKGELVPDTTAPALTYAAPKGDALALQYMAQKFGAFQSPKPQTPWRGITFNWGEKTYPLLGYGKKPANPVYANIGLTDFKYWGKEYVPATDIVEPKVLAGKMQFPTSRETAKALMLEFKRKKYALKGAGIGGWHATVARIAKETRTQTGTSESPGLYVAPSLSKYFLRTGDKGANSYSLFGMFDKPQGGPSALFIKTSDITRIPKGIRSKGVKAMNEWLSKSAAKDKGYISPAFEFGKTEKEAIIPQDTLLSKRDKSFWGFDKYTVVDNTKVPIKTYDIKMEAAARKNAVPFKAIAKQYEKEMNSYRNFKKPVISAERILKNSYNARAKETQQYTPTREYKTSSYSPVRRMPYSFFRERYTMKRESYRPPQARRPSYGGSSYRVPISRSRIVEERRDPFREVSRMIERARPRPPPRNIYRGISQRPPAPFRNLPSARPMYNPSRVSFRMPKLNLGRWKSKTMYSLRPDLISAQFSLFERGSASKPAATRKNIEEFKKYLDTRQPFFATREQRRR